MEVTAGQKGHEETATLESIAPPISNGKDGHQEPDKG